jgi:hypothetical protein
MSESRKETIKSWDDVRHAFDDILKCPLNRFGWHKFLAPRYIDGSLSIHVHAIVNISGRRQGICWECSSFLRSVVSNKDCNRLDVGEYDNWKAVLVRVFREIEKPERLIPTTVRLNGFDFIEGTCGNLVMRKTVKITTTRLRGLEYREVGSIFPVWRADEPSPDIMTRACFKNTS